MKARSTIFSIFLILSFLCSGYLMAQPGLNAQNRINSKVQTRVQSNVVRNKPAKTDNTPSEGLIKPVYKKHGKSILYGGGASKPLNQKRSAEGRTARRSSVKLDYQNKRQSEGKLKSKKEVAGDNATVIWPVMNGL